MQPLTRQLITTLILLACSLTAAAETTQAVYEAEPNNTPADATRISGAVSLLGSLPGNDQDGYLWTVSDNDARKRWTFELQGIPGALTIVDVVRLEYADNGIDVISADRLLKIGTRDGLTAKTVADLLFEPGEYLIGIAHSGGPSAGTAAPFRPPAAGLSFGDGGNPEGTAVSPDVTTADPSQPDAVDPSGYRFHIREGKRLLVRSDSSSQDDRESARSIRPGDEFAAFESGASSWFAIPFAARDSERRWDVSAQVPSGRSVSATLYDADGERLATARSSASGHLVFADLAPQTETYYIELTAEDPGFIRAIGSEATGQRVDGEEAEPNGEWRLANRIDIKQPLTARTGVRNDSDYFHFTLDEATSDRVLALTIDSETQGGKIEFCLLSDTGSRIQCRNDTIPLTLSGLVLNPGSWGLSVARAQEGLEYRISLEDTGPIESGREAEPNDTVEFATSVPSNNRIKGRIEGDDTDFFRFVVTGEPQLWRFQVVGEGLNEVSYQDIASRQHTRARPTRGQNRIRLDNLFLLPGQHFLRVNGTQDTDYTVLARPLGPPDRNSEREPNNDDSRTQRLAMGQTRTGLLSDPDDRDIYRFFLANWDHIELTVQAPADGSISANLSWYGREMAIGGMDNKGGTLTLAGVFPPGDYQVALSPETLSEAEYHLTLQRLPRFSCARDCEPSGYRSDLHFVSPLPVDGILEGLSGDWHDLDTYELPLLDQPTDLLIHTPEPVSLSLGLDRPKAKALQYDAERGAYRTSVPAGGPYQLVIDSRQKPYRLALEFPDGPKFKSGGPLAADLKLSFDNPRISAYRSYGQRLTGRLELRNTGDQEIVAALHAATSDYRWHITLERDSISLRPGATESVQVRVLAAPDAWADRAVRISLLAEDDSGAQAETWKDIQVDREIPLQNPEFGWTIPEALRGGFNLAWEPFGAEWVGDLEKGPRFERLRDGLTFDGASFTCCAAAYGWAADYRPELTLKLPGETPVPVAGMSLSHFGSTNYLSNIRKGTLLLSEDGAHFVEALTFETLPVETEQYFTLPTPLPARFARLRIDETFNQRSGIGGVTLGEWKVIAQPGHDLAEGTGFNLAEPQYGGHLVFDSPPEFYPPTGILRVDGNRYRVRLKPGENQEYVIGFNLNRAAKIRRVEWVYGEDVEDADKFDRVIVSVSTGSPVGPWHVLTELDVAAVTSAPFELDTPDWVRFVRFTAIPKDDQQVAAAPTALRVIEQGADEYYRSVLTEWGYASRQSYFESLQELQPEAELSAVDNDSRERALLFEVGQPVRGQVALAKREHWYRMVTPDGHNTLEISLSGDPTVRTLVEMTTPQGNPVPLRKDLNLSTPSLHRFEAVVEPGSTLYFRVLEPPRNVVFTWDTSSSVSAYLPMIYNSLVAFASQVVPGQEAVNLLPFSSSPLLRDWYGEPYILQTILNDFPRAKSSSSAEHALQSASRLLAPLPGTKAIVIITDGVTVHHGPMWKEMAEIQPRVFGIGVGGGEPEHVDVFEDWASVNGGHYSHLVYEGEMEVAFDRAATLMRRPAEYTLVVNSTFREAPGPGSIEVVSGKSSVGSAAVELILDASGSMLQRLNGKRRIAIAKEVLKEAVTEHIPAGTPVALRVFGHKEADACRSDLEIPLTPLDSTAAASTIENIQAMNLARTPIADSLAAVLGDLKGAAGRSAIVLVTDGEETCEGDPAKAIELLKSRGLDVNLNIVGFAIDDPELAGQFADWAELGNGRYFAANDQEGLSEAIAQALRVPFDVYDGSGSVVAEGLLDGPSVQLDPGFYRVLVRNQSGSTFERVEVVGERTLTLSLD